MNRADTARLLTLAASFDARTIGDADVLAWQAALDGLDYARCQAAVVKHYRENTDRIMPAHIRRLARTTTDLTRGIASPTASVADDGSTLCGDCRLMHRSDESCAVLIADDTRWRRAIALFRRPREIETTTREAS